MTSRDTASPRRAVLITTSPQTISAFFVQQVRDLTRAGFELQAISSPDEHMDACREALGVPVHSVAMRRSISPLADCGAVWQIVKKLREIRPAIIQTHTPKAGLLGMIAARLAGVPVRIYTVNGIVWESRAGLQGLLLRTADGFAALLATRVLCVSPSVRNALLARGLCNPVKTVVLGHGASHGVNLRKFDPARFTEVDRLAVRAELGIAADALVLAFAGRIVRDKGIENLASAWRQVRESLPKAVLVLVGPQETGNAVSPALLAELRADPRIVMTNCPAPGMPRLYSAVDLLVHPTLREGLPNVLLEAGAMEVPVIATRATGCVDVVEDGVSGTLVGVGDSAALAAAILRMAGDGDFRRRVARAAKKNVTERFAEEIVSAQLVAEYRRLLAPG